jgi:hypothetical protein
MAGRRTEYLVQLHQPGRLLHGASELINNFHEGFSQFQAHQQKQKKDEF